MAENLFETQYNVTKKSKLIKFYESNKILIFSFVSIVVIVLASFSFYLENKEKKRKELREIVYCDFYKSSLTGDLNSRVFD